MHQGLGKELYNGLSFNFYNSMSKYYYYLQFTVEDMNFKRLSNGKHHMATMW